MSVTLTELGWVGSLNVTPESLITRVSREKSQTQTAATETTASAATRFPLVPLGHAGITGAGGHSAQMH